ncbi:MAG TPA: DUF4838 domain-containing protein, partial [Cyclobacteriaceae bacterium]|nr:DUF4838 domain-containing protein [Cyclobacteriaceae bacterium]
MTTSILKLQSQIIRISALCLALALFIPGGSLMAQRKKGKKQDKTPVEEGIVLTENGLSRYRIVIPVYATENEKKAATVLQEYLLEISGAALPIIASDKSRSSYEIVLGQNERLDELNTGISLNVLEADGFRIKTDSARLIIAGGDKKGTLNGVYTFLEKYLGCRMYMRDVRVFPKQDRIVVKQIDDQQVPVIKFRSTHYRTTWNQDYVDFHKLSHDANGNRSDWGLWVHTFHRLVPPETYFEKHPEYYSMVDGKRTPTQLCLSNPEVLKIVVQNLRKEMSERPEATYWSVSQNDNRRYCTCDKCKEIDDREGTPAGSIISFVNQVADQFPDKMISTLAYEYGRKAPRNLKPRQNVNIMLCSIEVFRDKPLTESTDSMATTFVRDVREWGRIASDIIIWDYVIQFNHLISPFPNLQVLQPNLQFFAENGVTAMFEQGNREVGGDFTELRSYLISKFLWDPYANADTVMNDFLNGYYSAAGKPIRQYIDIMREALLASGQSLRIFGSPVEAATSYLTPELIKTYNVLFDQAEDAVDTIPEILERVRIARLPLQYAMMEQAKMNYYGENGLFIKSDGKWIVRPDIRTMIDPFADLCIRQGVTRVKEWSTTPEAYRSAMYRLFTLGMKEHLAFGKKVKYLSPDSAALRENAYLMLTDGKRGSADPGFNWLYLSEKDVDVVIDLG